MSIFTIVSSLAFENINIIAVALFLIVITITMGFGRSSDFNPAGKHCYITGGSTGLGLALAKQLASLGAHVTIVACKEATLKEAAQAIKAACQSPNEQRVQWISADVGIAEQATAALHRAKTGFNGMTPEYIFTCAGLAYPRYFVTQPLSEFEFLMQVNYMGTLYTVHEATRLMVAEGIRGKLVMVSSTLGFLGFAGYTQYSPTKYAVRALAESLRHELLFYGIGVHCHFPGNIDSPGYEVENKTKPQFTRELDGDSEVKSPEVVAANLIRGVQNGYTFITNEFESQMFRALGSGNVPGNNKLIDGALAMIGWVASFFWRSSIDKRARTYGKTLAVNMRILFVNNWLIIQIKAIHLSLV
ncbi:hypothetical protein BDF19DRAFT_407422 [Syncephalis fuscata]|nr:hypothetical protein BDF19DRAFT_407422 [Syncephalis fuscata]